MFKSLTLFLGKLFFKSPVVHHLSPSLLNISFKNSKTINPVIINLKNISSIKFIVNLKKGNSVDDEYILVALIAGQPDIELGIFESRKEAEEALILLNIKISSLFKLFLKWIATLICVLFLLMLTKDIVSFMFNGSNSIQVNRENAQLDIRKIPDISGKDKAESKNSQNLKNSGQVSGIVEKNVSEAQQSPVLSDEELIGLFNDAQKLTQSQGSNINISGDNPPLDNTENNTPQQNLSPADIFIKGLK